MKMPNSLINEELNMDFIRLLFRDPVEEEVAHRWALRLAGLLGAQALQLRPGTTLRTMLRWAATANIDSIDFVVVFEPELRMDFAQFLDCCDHISFREMVEHYANRFGS
jgi:hypothetical protein